MSISSKERVLIQIANLVTDTGSAEWSLNGINFDNPDKSSGTPTSFEQSAAAERIGVAIQGKHLKISNAVFHLGLDLSGIDLASLTLRNCRICGSLDLSRSRFSGDLDMNSSTVEGRVDVRGVTVGGSFRAVSGRIDGDLHAGCDKRPKDPVRPSFGTIELDSAVIKGTANFGGAEVKGDMSAVFSDFAGGLMFRLWTDKRQLDELVMLEHFSCGGDLDLHGVKVGGNLSLRGIEVGKKVILTNAVIKGMLITRAWYCNERDDGDVFRDGDVPIGPGKQTVFKDDLVATRISVQGLVDLSGTHVHGRCDFDHAQIGSFLMDVRGTTNEKVKLFDSVGWTTLISERFETAYECRAWMWVARAYKNRQFHRQAAAKRRVRINERLQQEQRSARRVARSLRERTWWDVMTSDLPLRIKHFETSWSAEVIPPTDKQIEHPDLMGVACSDSVYYVTANVDSGAKEPLTAAEIQRDGTSPKHIVEQLKKRAAFRLSVEQNEQSDTAFLSIVQGKIGLACARVRGSVRISGAIVFGGIDLALAQIEGHLDLAASEVDPHGPTGLSADPPRYFPSLVGFHCDPRSKTVPKRRSVMAEGARIGGSVRIEGSIFVSGLNFLSSRIDGSFRMNSLATAPTLVGEATGGGHREYSIRLSASEVSGNVEFHGAFLERGLSLENSTVKGDVSGISVWHDTAPERETSERRTRLGQGRWTKQERAALLLNGLHCSGDVDLRGCFFDGGILCQEARLEGSLFLGGLSRNKPSGTMSPESQLRFDSERYFTSFVAYAQDSELGRYSVFLNGSMVAGDVDFGGAFLAGGVRMSNAVVNGQISFHSFKPYLETGDVATGLQAVKTAPGPVATVVGIGRGAGLEQAYQGEIELHCSFMGPRMTVGSHIYLQGAHFLSGIELSGTEVKGYVFGEPHRHDPHSEPTETIVGPGTRSREGLFCFRMAFATVGGSVRLDGLKYGISEDILRAIQFLRVEPSVSGPSDANAPQSEQGTGPTTVTAQQSAVNKGSINRDHRVFPVDLESTSVAGVVAFNEPRSGLIVPSKVVPTILESNLRSLTCNRIRIEIPPDVLAQGGPFDEPKGRRLHTLIRYCVLSSPFLASLIMMVCTGYESGARADRIMILAFLAYLAHIYVSSLLSRKNVDDDVLSSFQTSGLQTKEFDFEARLPHSGPSVPPPVPCMVLAKCRRPLGHGYLDPYYGSSLGYFLFLPTAMLVYYAASPFAPQDALFMASIASAVAFMALRMWFPILWWYGHVWWRMIIGWFPQWSLFKTWRLLDKTRELDLTARRRSFLSRCGDDHGVFLLMESILRNEGDHKGADDVALMWRARSLAKDKRFWHKFGHASLFVWTGHGVRIWPMLVGIALLLTWSTVLFSDPHSARRTLEYTPENTGTLLDHRTNPKTAIGWSKWEESLSKAPGNVPHEWGWQDGLWLSVRSLVPFASFAAPSEWEVSRRPIRVSKSAEKSEVFRKVFVTRTDLAAVRYDQFASALTVVGWIVIPLLLASLLKQIPRIERRSAKD